jgi:plastocyanin
MVQYRYIILITAIWLAVLFSGCAGKQEGTPVPSPTATVTAIPLVTATQFPEATPTGNMTLVKLDSKRGFVPDTVTINAGDEIVWDNYYADTVTLISNDGIFDAWILAYHQQYRYIFKKPGTYTFYLEQNKSLTGTITVEAQATTPTAPLPVTAPNELPQGTLYVDAQLKKPSSWGNENYSLDSLKVQIYNQVNMPLSIRAQIVSDGKVLEETSFILQNEGSNYQFTNEKKHFIKSTDVILRLLVQGYDPVEYNFKIVDSLG